MRERRRQRAETVGTLLRSATTFLVFGIALVTILGELGINLTPIVASAGIVGVAVGFGAQNLVRDFLTGIFMILEDQYGVGDVIDVGPPTASNPVSGTVEAVSLRITRLRDVNGVVWHVRNGEILRVGNMSLGWARAVVDVPVAPGTPIEEARRVLLAAAMEVRRGRALRRRHPRGPRGLGRRDVHQGRADRAGGGPDRARCGSGRSPASCGERSGTASTAANWPSRPLPSTIAVAGEGAGAARTAGRPRARAPAAPADAPPARPARHRRRRVGRHGRARSGRRLDAMAADPAAATDAAQPWWRDGVVYQVYVRSFADASGDGVGDLPGVRAHLPYLAVARRRRALADPVLRLADGRPRLRRRRPARRRPAVRHASPTTTRCVADAHALGLRVINDIVPNHTSDRHAWFVEALASPPGSPARDRYVFRDGRGPDGDEPPNNWQSTFGGPAWRRVAGPDGRPEQWYLHLFAPEQPDLNWRNPEVGDDAERTLRFWLDRGADGFRIDVAHGLHKDPELRDNPVSRGLDQPDRQRDEVHLGPARGARRLPPLADGLRLLSTATGSRSARSGSATRRGGPPTSGPDELHLAFTFALTLAPWSAAEWRTAVEAALSAVGAVGATATWVLGNHDVSRPVTRYGSAARARAGLLTTLALPGAYYLYQGDELGLPDVDVPPDMRQDPMWERLGVGRDGCRAPMPWESDAPHHGFSTVDAVAAGGAGLAGAGRRRPGRGPDVDAGADPRRAGRAQGDPGARDSAPAS